MHDETYNISMHGFKRGYIELLCHQLRLHGEHPLIYQAMIKAFRGKGWSREELVAAGVEEVDLGTLDTHASAIGWPAERFPVHLTQAGGMVCE